MEHSLTCNNSYLIVAIDTDLGKTFLTENLCQKLLKKSIAIHAIKPIVSGFNDDDLNGDSNRILSALNYKISKENLDLISPWRFVEASSPHAAANNLNQEIDFGAVVDFCKRNITQAQIAKQILLIEAAGGLMTPINNSKTFFNLALELKIPVLLLSANYLGSISHTLCAAEVLKNGGIIVEKIIVNEDLPHNKKSSNISHFQFIKTIEDFSKITTTSLNNFLELQ